METQMPRRLFPHEAWLPDAAIEERAPGRDGERDQIRQRKPPCRYANYAGRRGEACVLFRQRGMRLFTRVRPRGRSDTVGDQKFLAVLLGAGDARGSMTGRRDQASVVGLTGIRSTLPSTARGSEDGNRLGRRRRAPRPQAPLRRCARRRPRRSSISKSSAQPTASGAGCETERRRPSFFGYPCVVQPHP